MNEIDPVEVAERVAEARARIAAAGGDLSGPLAVRIVAVTKTFGADAVRAAVAAGCDAIGENYAQELVAKMASFGPGEPRPQVHFIGRIQSNKVRTLVDVVDVWQSVDRVSVVNEIARRAPAASILVQVNATGEPDKGGCAPDVVVELVGTATSSGLTVLGLMTVGPTHGDAVATRTAFSTTRRLCDDLGLEVCSMGMTHDLEIAVEEGATMVRLGTALFGRRDAR
jgi:pyridoxal phosphate enzyme (YggS family)